MTERDFQAVYHALEQDMRELAEQQGAVYLPNPEPAGPVKYVFICMEPSLGRWAQSTDDARRKVAAGFRNFVDDLDTALLHYSVRRFLCPGERYHITDLAKGAMHVEQAGEDRFIRWDTWYPLLLAELDLVAAPDATILAVGSLVARYLQQKRFARPFQRILHYSGLAAAARKAAITGREDEFHAFTESVTLDDVVATMADVCTEAHVPPVLREPVLAKLRARRLTPSQKRLVFAYKCAFRGKALETAVTEALPFLRPISRGGARA